MNGVAAVIRAMIQRGVVPYVQSYCFGDNGLRGNFEKAVQFDTAIAQAIGSSIAFVNIDTEWDDGAVLDILSSPAGIQSFKNRIQVYRQFAPMTKLLSSPGLWKTDAQYAWFAQIDALLDMRSNIFFATSNERSCLLKPDGVSIGVTGKSLNEALAMGDKINADRLRFNRLWGSSATKYIITGDAAVTSCGWGETNQAAIINKLVDRMDCLYSDGWRGANIRNAGPDNLWERAMGVQNEGQFVYSNGVNARNAMKRGLDRAIQIMKNGATCVPPPPTPFTVSHMKSSSQNWAQLTADPSFDVAGIVLNYNGQSTRLSKASWGEEWVGAANIASGTSVQVVIEKTSGGSTTVQIAWLQSDSAPTPSPTPAPAPAPTPAPAPGPAPAGSLTVTNTGSNEWWAQVQLSPKTGITSVTISYLGVIQPLKLESYGDWTSGLSSRIPSGTRVTVTYVKSGSSFSQAIIWAV